MKEHTSEIFKRFGERIQYIVNAPKQGVVISSPMCVNLSVKEPVFAELTNIRKASLSKEKEPLLISFNQLQLAVSTPAQAELAAVLISRMQSLC